jgi:hypothetical protein
MSDMPEAVHSVDDWYDGPRSGAADYQGAAYWYRSLYRDEKEWNPDEDRFELTLLTPEALSWETERQAIFRRWDSARQAGTIDWRDEVEEGFGALPEEMDRLRSLIRSIEAFLRDHAATLLVRGRFGPGCDEVRWTFLRWIDGPGQGDTDRDSGEAARRFPRTG